jgi:hypothetical protein
MSRSAEFDYVPVTIPKECLRSLWTLSLSENEWAGRLVVDQGCNASCNVELIEGTVIEETSGMDSVLYLGKDKAFDKDKKLKPVRMASVYIPMSEYEKVDTCDKGKINVIFHTHPLLLVRDKDTHIARIALPSLGDVWVHCVLSNMLNYETNQHVNCTIIVAFEGLYLYSILPHKFRQIHTTYTNLIAKGMTHKDAVNELQQHTFDELRPVNNAFFKDMKAYCDAHPDKFGTDGAPDIRNTMWDCKGCVVKDKDLTFPFAEAIKTPLVRDYARENPFTEGIIKHGYHCEFFPAPFDSDLTLLAPSKVTFVENRNISEPE